jgi:flagellar assembly factor FliW
MKIQTGQFGPIEFEEAAILHFPEGLLGFEHMKRFLLIDQDEIEPLRWLQPIDEPAVSFTVIAPHIIWDDYQPKLTGEDKKALQLGAGNEPLVFALVTVPDDPSNMTANLLGPLVINPEQRIGRQIVMHDTGYTTRHRLIPDTARSASDVVTV